ncbi:hypothetical protein [Algoriphagus aquimarinus]|uniref:Lipocalin-like domain-containing protein n=1 Tax=Algoriphagus aquimarinus TaxID=237018 RepID=A0A5C7AN63_9BACT|nr:hypothetical protein [Algoriphagus aquimarinus]TXE10216.1 hypothetical protein ESV85_12815 [Algoriphagus aquimarinus]
MKNKRKVLSCLIILLTGVIYFAVHAQQKNDTQRADFSGVWKSKESISMGGNIVCSFDSGDRMLANFMKISQQENALNIEISSSFPGTAPVAGKETLTFDGKESQINHGPERGKKFSVKWSADGQTMTVNSTVHLMIASPYKVNSHEQMIVYVTEVWKLSNDGKSISVQAKAKSDSLGEERFWTTVFDKAN